MSISMRIPTKKRDCSEHAFTIIEQQENMSRTFEPIAVEEKKEFKNRRWFRSSSDIERRVSMDSPHNLCLWISLLDLHVEWVSEEMLLRGAQCEFSFYRCPRCSIRLCSIGNFERILKSCYIFVFSVPQQRLEIFRMKADNARVSIVNGTYRKNDKICFRCKISFPRSPRATEI